MKPVLCVSEKELLRMNEGDKWIKAWLPPTTMVENVELYTADQLRQAKVETLREAAEWFENNGWDDVQRELRRLIDELERSKT